jgi:hypothetical protein
VSGSPETILNAWFDASTSTSEGTAAAMGPMTTGGVTDMNHHYRYALDRYAAGTSLKAGIKGLRV